MKKLNIIVWVLQALLTIFYISRCIKAYKSWTDF